MPSVESVWLNKDKVSVQFVKEPSEAEKLDMIERYFELMREFRGDRYALAHIRRRISWFAKTMGPTKPLKQRFNDASSVEDIYSAMREFRAGGLRWFPGAEPRSARTEMAAL